MASKKARTSFQGRSSPTEPGSANKEALDEIRRVLSLFPPQLPEESSDARSTRKPQFYDKHLASDLLLKKVIYCPQLTQKLRDIADIALLDLGKGSKAIPKPFDSHAKTSRQLQMLIKRIFATEEDVAGAYKEAAQSIVNIASLLAFKSPSSNTQFFRLSSSDNVASGEQKRTRKGYAKPDIVLKLDPEFCDSHVLPSSLSAVNKIAQWFTHIAVIEMKSLVTGSYEVMLAMLSYALADSFPWEGCNSEHCAQKCGGSLGRVPITGDRMGYDAQCPLVPLSGAKLKVDIQEAMKSTDSHDLLNGRHMLQQLWAEGVKHDATFLAIHGGNWEIVAVRERGSQTMYVSDIVQVSHPGYIKLHVGMYIAAFRDAEDRAEQLAQSQSETWIRAYDRGYGSVTPEPTPREKFYNVLRYYPKLCLQSTGRRKRKDLTYVEEVPYLREHKSFQHEPFEDPENCFRLRLRSTGEANKFVGTLELREHTYKENVFVRTAQGSKATKHLQYEYMRHKNSAQKPDLHMSGIQEPYGFFTFKPKSLEGQEDIYGLLILEYVEGSGRPIACLRKDHQQAFINRVLNLHSERGLLLGNLEPHHFVVDRNQETWIIDLSCAMMPEKSKKERQMKKEIQELRRVLRAGMKAGSKATRYTIGPVPGNYSGKRKQIFEDIISWMPEPRPWLEDVKCSKSKADIDSGTYLDVRFTKEVDAEAFKAQWGLKRPPELENVDFMSCIDFSASQESYLESQDSCSTVCSPSPREL